MSSIAFFVLVLFCSVTEISVINVVGIDCKCTPLANSLQKFNNHVLKRRIRSVVFPTKAQLLLTPAFTKAVLDGRPRGLSYSVEFDMYSPLPDTIEGWKPTILMNKLKPQSTSQNYNYRFTSHIQEETQPYEENYDYYNFPFEEAPETNHSNLKWNIELIRDSNAAHVFADHFHKQPYFKKTYRRSRRFSLNWRQNFSGHNSTFAKNKTSREQRQFHNGNQGDVERKRILKQLEIVGKVFKFNMKSCIRRTMCELTSRSDHRPYGESVMEDILRLVLFPSYSSHESGRVNNFSANYSNANCEQHFAASCPYRILDFIFKNINIDTLQ